MLTVSSAWHGLQHYHVRHALAAVADTELREDILWTSSALARVSKGIATGGHPVAGFDRAAAGV